VSGKSSYGITFPDDIGGKERKAMKRMERGPQKEKQRGDIKSVTPILKKMLSP